MVADVRAAVFRMAEILRRVRALMIAGIPGVKTDKGLPLRYSHRPEAFLSRALFFRGKGEVYREALEETVNIKVPAGRLQYYVLPTARHGAVHEIHGAGEG